MTKKSKYFWWSKPSYTDKPKNWKLGEFKRDGGGIVYLKTIYLTPEEYKRTLRELKLKRILNNCQ